MPAIVEIGQRIVDRLPLELGLVDRRRGMAGQRRGQRDGRRAEAMLHHAAAATDRDQAEHLALGQQGQRDDEARVLPTAGEQLAILGVQLGDLRRLQHQRLAFVDHPAEGDQVGQLLGGADLLLPARAVRIGRTDPERLTAVGEQHDLTGVGHRRVGDLLGDRRQEAVQLQARGSEAAHLGQQFLQARVEGQRVDHVQAEQHDQAEQEGRDAARGGLQRRPSTEQLVDRVLQHQQGAEQDQEAQRQQP